MSLFNLSISLPAKIRPWRQLEVKIGEMEALLATEGFYQETSREEQQRVIDQKHALDAQLMRAMEQWEKASLDLQLCEEPSA